MHKSSRRTGKTAGGYRSVRSVLGAKPKDKTHNRHKGPMDARGESGTEGGIASLTPLKPPR
jgi:hypothetical protein